MRVKPYQLAFSLYFSFNVIFYFWFLYTETLYGDFSGWIVLDKINYLYSGAIEISLIFLFYFGIIFLYRIYTGSEKNEDKNIEYFFYKRKNIISFFVLGVQIAYFSYSYVTGIGALFTLESTEAKDIGPAKYLFTFFNPDILFLLTAILSSKRKMTYLDVANIIFYFISSTYRGWISGACLNLVFIFLFRRKFLKINLLYALFIGMFSVSIFFPAIYYTKYVSRGAETLSLEALSKYYDESVYNDVLVRALSRFQHISEVYILFENHDTLINAYNNAEFIPFVFDNQLKRHLSAIFGVENSTIGEYSAHEILKRESGGNIHVGIYTWFYISPVLSFIYILFFIFWVLFSIKTMQWLAPKEAVLNVIIWFWLLYFMHGWFFNIFIMLSILFSLWGFEKISRIPLRNKIKH